MSFVSIQNGDTGLTARGIINGIGTDLDSHTSSTGSMVHGLKNMVLQSASAVAITGGTVNATISGTISSSLVSITGGTINNTRVSVTSVAVNTSLNADHMVVLVSGSANITVPTAVGVSGRMYHIKNVGTETITVTATGSQVIDGQSSLSISSRYSSIQIISDGSNWNII